MENKDWYTKEDPWGYQTNPDDAVRKKKILSALGNLEFERALDVGAGEGWITKDLPAKQLFAYECSDDAISRLPDNVSRVTEPEGKYDLVVATGVLYKQYDYQHLTRIILEHASGIILTSNIKSWEINGIPNNWLIHEEEFPYRDHVQHLCVYEVPSIT